MKELTEKEAEKFLEKEGFNVVDRIVIKMKSQIKLAQKKIEFPWAMKASSKKIVHKARVGGVMLNINNEEKAVEAFDKLSKMDGFEEIMIQKMVNGIEVIIGIKKTPEFDHVLMFGKGGSDVEKHRDVSFRVIPLSNKDIEEMMNETKFFNNIMNEVNLKELKGVFEKIIKLVKKHSSIIELDINPLIVNEKKAFVVDSRMVIG